MLEIQNTTKHAAELLVVPAEKAKVRIVSLVQASYGIQGNSKLVPLDEPHPIVLEGAWNGEPDQSSIQYEPQGAMPKPGTDIVMHGMAYPTRAGDTQVDVGLMVGSVRKIARVFGKRRWMKMMGSVISRPETLQPTPLLWELAYGGWDRSSPDPKKHRKEPRNPVGKGFYRSAPPEGDELPCIELPNQLIRSPADRPTPAGFGFVSPDWKPRVDFAGTHDDAWTQSRMPLAPLDQNPLYYHAACHDLIHPRPCMGNEPVAVVGVSPRGRLQFNLPGEPPPKVSLEAQTGLESLEMKIDTILVDALAHEVRILWRGTSAELSDPAEVNAMIVGEKPPAMQALMFTPMEEG